MENSNDEKGLFTVKLGTVLANNIKQYNGDVAKMIERTAAQQTIATEKDEVITHRVHAIRRRRKFVYHAADQIIDKGYWNRERQSLTKYHSNSLAYEYTRLK